jgi:hypothetical protein
MATTRIVGPVESAPASTSPVAPSTSGVPLVAPTLAVPSAATQRQSVPVIPAVPSAMTVTAEIPAVMVSSGRRAAHEEPGWYKERRRPAPWGVRALIWLLFFVLLLALAGLAVEHYHPTWLNFMRHTNSQAAVVQATTSTTNAPTTSSSAPTTTVPVTTFRELSRTASAITYAVPASAYTIVVTTVHPCWTTVNVPAGSKKLVYAETIQPSTSPASFAVQGSSSIAFSAQAAAVAIEIHGHVIGRIATPVEFPVYYYFKPVAA